MELIMPVQKVSRPRAGCLPRKSEAEIAAEIAAQEQFEALGNAFCKELQNANEALDNDKLNVGALADAMLEHGPAMVLAMFNTLFPQFDLEVSHNATAMNQISRHLC
jgi:hypothetical protein